MRIVLDLMGGDQAPDAPIEGASTALARDPDLEVAFVGQAQALAAARAATKNAGGRVVLVEAAEVIGNDEQPALAVRRKKDSSMVVGLQCVKSGEGDAFVSCGSTGALLSAGLFAFGRVPGVRRPALGSVFPNMSEPGKTWFMLDIGANVDATAEDLRTYAVLGSVYSRMVLGVPNPSVALLNIGIEAQKGNEIARQAFDLLKSTPGLSFAGNVEARDILSGPVDVVVCDAFVGNILLKGMEGLLMQLAAAIRRELRSGGPGVQLGGALTKSALSRALRIMDYREYGGAPLFGVNGPCIKCHGSSNGTAVAGGIQVATEFAGKGVLAAMAGALGVGTARDVGKGPGGDAAQG